MNIKKKWVASGSWGYWEVSNGVDTVCCDDSELDETIRELSNG